jgi:hypothetical protein
VGLPEDLTTAEINKVLKSVDCTTCELCKRNKLPTRVGDGFHADHPGAVISVDYQGLISPVSVRGYTGFFFFKPRKFNNFNIKQQYHFLNLWL